MCSSKVMLTGATGFVGAAFLQRLSGREVVAFGRRPPNLQVAQFYCGEIGSNTDYREALAQVGVVIHCAARAHIMDEHEVDPLYAYREVNTFGTLNLARQAAKAGVRRFIFISSIKVNGEATAKGAAFTELDASNPLDAYGRSKMEAEEGLLTIAEQTGMEVVIIRPPLIYGPGVKANFLNLMKLANSSWPLPFAAIQNARSMLYLGNLVDFIETCIDHPTAANQIFLLSDGQDLSLARLLQLLRTALFKPARLFAITPAIFRMAGAVSGKQKVVDRLLGSLRVDSSKAHALLNWQPPFSVEQGIAATVNDFLQKNKVKGE